MRRSPPMAMMSPTIMVTSVSTPFIMVTSANVMAPTVPVTTPPRISHSNPWIGGAAPLPGSASGDLIGGDSKLALATACSPVPCIDALCVTSL
jgi:hypothetical protein